MGYNVEVYTVHGLSRRTFIKGIAFGALELALLGCNTQRISFQDALNNANIRQRYLEMLVNDSPSEKYLQEVIYDHNRSKVLDALKQEAEYIFNNARLLVFFKAIYPEIKSQDDLVELWKKKIDLFHAYMPSYTNGFGLKKKSQLYVFPNLFETIELKYGREEVKIEPSEEIIETVIEHEKTHAKDIYDGIRVGNGIIIDSSNYLNLHPQVLSFVAEVRAYLSGINFARKLGKDHPAYTFALFSFLSYMYYNDARTVNIISTPLETTLVDFHIKMAETLLSDESK